MRFMCFWALHACNTHFLAKESSLPAIELKRLSYVGEITLQIYNYDRFVDISMTKAKFPMTHDDCPRLICL